MRRLRLKAVGVVARRGRKRKGFVELSDADDTAACARAAAPECCEPEPVAEVPAPHGSWTCLERLLARVPRTRWWRLHRIEKQRRAIDGAQACIAMTLLATTEQMRECRAKSDEAQANMQREYDAGRHTCAIECLRRRKKWQAQYAVILKRRSALEAQALALERVTQNAAYGESLRHVARALKTVSSTATGLSLRQLDGMNDVIANYLDDEQDVADALDLDPFEPRDVGDDDASLWEELLVETGGAAKVAPAAVAAPVSPPKPPPAAAAVIAARVLPPAPTGAVKVVGAASSVEEQEEREEVAIL